MFLSSSTQFPAISLILVIGGFCLFWIRELDAHMLFINKYMIHASVSHCISPCTWFLTCAYDPHMIKTRNCSGILLKQIANSMDEPWLVIGDLNLLMKN